MSARPLTDREQQAWAELESALRRDRRFERRVAAAPVRPRWRRALLPLMAVLSMTLLVVGVTSSHPLVIAAFGVVWTATVLGVFRLLFRAFS
ncbi:DUF3040 domain-containing protein [Streptomyces sp. NPDC005963]|uniref:DUF3040 domain-containing protein n=1 Tax=Streptomyces sp. NPDC005963 TaxID=3156721 RepID=UPI0033CA4E5F